MSEKVNGGQKGGKGKIIPLFSGYIEAPPYKLQKPPAPAYGQEKQQYPYGQEKQQPSYGQEKPSGPSQGSNSNLLVTINNN